MLSIAQINLPKYLNNGRPCHNEVSRIEAMLLNVYGGMTKHNAQGLWQAPSGRVYDEAVTVYSIAADWHDATNGSKLLAIARFAAGLLDQECIFVALPSGVQFVTQEQPAMAVAA